MYCGLQTCIGDRMRLAGVVMQVDWQAVLQGSQMMQRPKEFARIAEESVAQNMERIRQEASSRGWLSNDLPSGRLSFFSAVPVPQVWICLLLLTRDFTPQVLFFNTCLASPHSR